MANKQPQEMVIVRGLQGSGKSTFAHDWVSQDPDWRIRINRDDTRKMIANKYWGLTRHQEENVTQLTEAHAHRALKSQLSVVIDNTNLRASDVKGWYKIANEYDVPVRVVDMDQFSIEECIANDQNRLRVVGEKVIRNYAQRFFVKGKFPPVPENNRDKPEGEPYVPDRSLPKAFLVDVDGTLAERVHDGATQPVRGPFDEARVGEDALIPHVKDTVVALKNHGYKIIIMSGRTDACMSETIEWLGRHEIPFDDIHMRKSGDQRKDSVVKEELLLTNVAPNYWVVAALDDRQQVVDHYRQVLHLPVYQVNYGDF